MTRRFLIAAAALALIQQRAVAADELPPRPRLLLTEDAEDRIRGRLASDPLVRLAYDAVLVTAEAALTRRPCEHRIPDGKRLLAESRHAIEVVLHTAMAWRLTGDRRFFDRAVRELDAACALPDWNPSHFLDVAEMATAVALGSDWLDADLRPEQRQRYHDALRTKAIEPARQQLTSKASWPRVHNNWSQVCGAGIMAACAAIADNEQTLSTTPFAECLGIVERSARFYEPDGGYPEGPGYWDYGTEYHVLGLALAEQVGRKTFVPRHLLAGAAFMAHVRGPSQRFFNFADASPGTDPLTAARGWLIDRAPDVALATDFRNGLWERRDSFAKKGANNRFFALHLLWLPAAPAAAAPRLPLAAAFRGEQPTAMLRSAWDDPQALFVAAKGGTPGASHGHMDVGSFVLEAAGRRWIHDLGGDDYNLPGYFGKQRWSYFRLNARSHNVVLIGDRMQNPACPPCPITSSQLDTPPYSVRFDLTPAYTFGATRLAASVEREVSLDPEGQEVRIRDTIRQPIDTVRWQCLIDVAPRLVGNQATLVREGRAMTLEISPATATWQSAPAAPPTPEERQNEGYYLLFATFPRPNQSVPGVPDAPLIIEVVLRPSPSASE